MSIEMSFEERLSRLRGILTKDRGDRLEMEFYEKLQKEEQRNRGVNILENRVRPLLENIRQIFFEGDARVEYSYHTTDDHEEIDSKEPILSLVWGSLPGQTARPDVPVQSLTISLFFAPYNQNFVDLVVNGAAYIPFSYAEEGIILESENWPSRLQREILLQLIKGAPADTRKVLEKQLELTIK